MKQCRAGQILYAVLLCFSVSAFALESDARQPITIDSNQATYDEKKAVSIYTGNVILVQGSLRVKSDKLIVYLQGGDVRKLVASGKPARFRQIPAPGKDEIKGKALTAEYYPDKELLILLKDAVVWQGNNTYTSEIIKYDSKNAIVKAGEQSSDSKRVRVILQPKKKAEQ